MIFEVGEEDVAPVRASLKVVDNLIKALEKIHRSGDDDGSIAVAENFDHKACNAGKSKLKKALAKLERRQRRG